MNHYNLDVIISLGYRVKSQQGTQFRIWATQRLKEYIIKGFALNDERFKKGTSMNYFSELQNRIREIRISEKFFYQKIKDIYATSIDYDARDEETIQFFKSIFRSYATIHKRKASFNRTSDNSMRTFSIIASIILLLFVGSACDDGDSETVWVALNERQCENEWSCYAGCSTEENIQLYFADKNITVLELVIDDAPDGIAYCCSCDCITGRLINVLIDEQDVISSTSNTFYCV